VLSHPAAPQLQAMLSWCLVSWVIVGGATLAGGPLREGILAELMGSPRLALEFALGFGAGLAAIWAGLELGVPGAPCALRLWTPPVLLFGAWTLAIGYGLIHPSASPMMDVPPLIQPHRRAARRHHRSSRAASRLNSRRSFRVGRQSLEQIGRASCRERV